MISRILTHHSKRFLTVTVVSNTKLRLQNLLPWDLSNYSDWSLCLVFCYFHASSCNLHGLIPQDNFILLYMGWCIQSYRIQIYATACQKNPQHSLAFFLPVSDQLPLAFPLWLSFKPLSFISSLFDPHILPICQRKEGTEVYAFKQLNSCPP